MRVLSPSWSCTVALFLLAVGSQLGRAAESQKQGATPDRTKASQKNNGPNNRVRGLEKHKRNGTPEKSGLPRNPDTERSQNKDDPLSQSCPATFGKAGHLDNALLTDLSTNYTCITIRDCPQGPCTVPPQ